MVDPRINIERRKPFVDMIGPCLAPPFQKLGAVPLAHLLAEPLRPYLAHRQPDVRVRLGLVVLAHFPMHFEVSDPAAFDELLVPEIARQLATLLTSHFHRYSQTNSPSQLRALSFPAVPPPVPHRPAT